MNFRHLLGCDTIVVVIEIKGPVKLIQQVKTARSFLKSVSNQFRFVILSFPICSSTYACERITFKYGEIGHFNLQSHF